MQANTSSSVNFNRTAENPVRHPLLWFKQHSRELKPVAQRTGRTPGGMFLSYAMHKCVYGSQFEQFLVLRLYDYSLKKKREFLLSRGASRLKKKYFDPDFTREDIDLFWDKHQFNQAFRSFIRREWLYAPDCTQEQFRAFVDRHPMFLRKFPAGTQGKGVTLCHREQLDIDSFFAECQSSGALLEEYIVQHPDMASLNPSSVNTVRIVTARFKGQVMAVGAGLRAGGAGSHLDNFHAGGCAYPLDIDTGIVTGPGADLSGNEYLRHPASGQIMPGFQVPHWDILLDTVSKAALVSPRIGWVGWDVAVLPDGVELIEGNDDPMVTLIQLGGNGVYRKLKAFLRQA